MQIFGGFICVHAYGDLWTERKNIYIYIIRKYAITFGKVVSALLFPKEGREREREIKTVNSHVYSWIQSFLRTANCQ